MILRFVWECSEAELGWVGPDHEKRQNRAYYCWSVVIEKKTRADK